MKESGAVSADGRYVAFVSSAPALGVPATAREGIVVRDTVTGASVLASRTDGPDGAAMTDRVASPSISADGRRVAFVVLPENEPTEVWVRDLASGATIFASCADSAAGAPANTDAFAPSIDADGSRVEFLSGAGTLFGGNGDTDPNAYVRDLDQGKTILASRADGSVGQAANAAVRSASLSADGDHVAFSTDASNLGDGDTDKIADVHVRDLRAGTTRLASVSSAGTKGDSGAENPSIDADGTRVAFDSGADLGSVPLPPASREVWVRDLTSGTTILASRADGSDGAPGKEASSSSLLSADGRRVAFDSTSPTLLPSAWRPVAQMGGSGGAAGPSRSPTASLRGCRRRRFRASASGSARSRRRSARRSGAAPC